MDKNILQKRLMKSFNSKGVRFSNYQDIPQFVTEKLENIDTTEHYEKSQLNLDHARYEFLENSLECNSLSVTEIGANLGYFLLRLAKEKRCVVTGYEPISEYAQAASLMSQLTDIDDYCTFHSKGVLFDDIRSLPTCDLIIELNVLHHAGNIFDKEKVASFSSWETYAINRLAAMRDKASNLFIQTGNSQENIQLFPSEEAVSHFANILSQAGWKVKSLGTIQNLNNLTYTPGSLNDPQSYTTYKCHRNLDTGLVYYEASSEVVGSYQTGLANRPVWLCE